ncbi:bifunctional 3'-5' exonuclease/DNA polymerase [Microbacterium sp. SORGH_AS_0505]|uniref:bifunctional 3'-5' exonuclease/DNA polymerase n=1 Tax=Microbacterium sp. SORGH_AS_0505 TaxID=3041770 RepID=UPI0027D780A6|nr:bifunctional 3'-5' exonuclease/DNA polymerase [Microbacterium sp. SORGH_AS_0505]
MRVHPGPRRRLRALTDPGAPAAGAVPWIVVGAAEGRISLVLLDVDGRPTERVLADATGLADRVRRADESTRWVWSDTSHWYPALIAAGVRVARCHDLRLAHAILRDSALAVDAEALRRATEWDAAASVADDGPSALFDLDPGSREAPHDIEAALAEFERQREVIAAGSPSLRLLVAAESVGALVAAEMHAAGVPWDGRVHDEILTGMLGERDAGGRPPARIVALAAEIRGLLGDPGASLDSQPKLLRALHRVGVAATSTSKWELTEYDHPVVAPLLEYKRLMRMYTANGWAWREEWAPAGRFRPVYVPGGVVTGRWASSGGGALQLPRQLRPAVRADQGWTLVVADVAQLEPRVLAAMSRDAALADSARGTDLYEGIVSRGVVSTRSEAKFALLGAMYGATTGDSGRLVPALRRAYPRAMGLVDDAARVGEEGGVVSTWLGRSSPAPSPGWRAVQSRAGDPDATETDRTQARRIARDRGRFTRNFVVQGTAAEWALAWLGDLRARLAALPPVDDADAAPRSGALHSRQAHLGFFLHDEVIVHAPAAHAEQAADAVRLAADAATRLLFGDIPLDFRLDLQVRIDAAKD